MKLKKWCEHIDTMSMKIPVWKVKNELTYHNGWTDKVWYVLDSQDVDNYNYCPICGKAKPIK